ncbi:putative lipoprotein [Klebsiella pneumoniae KP-11]|nr:putative lipoprotein [Klebsiella pneumoniae KP-11]
MLFRLTCFTGWLAVYSSWKHFLAGNTAFLISCTNYIEWLLFAT